MEIEGYSNLPTSRNISVQGTSKNPLRSRIALRRAVPHTTRGSETLACGWLKGTVPRRFVEISRLQADAAALSLRSSKYTKRRKL
jgi:hypothetical protein